NLAFRTHFLGTFVSSRCGESAVVTAADEFRIRAPIIARRAARLIEQSWYEVVELGPRIRYVERRNDHHEHLEQLKGRRGGAEREHVFVAAQWVGHREPFDVLRIVE